MVWKLLHKQGFSLPDDREWILQTAFCFPQIIYTTHVKFYISAIGETTVKERSFVFILTSNSGIAGSIVVNDILAR